MGSRHLAAMIVAGLVAFLGTVLAGETEGRGAAPPAPATRDTGPGPDIRRAGGPGGLPGLQPGGQPGDSLPAVREEMQRYRQALREVFAGSMALAREIDSAFRQLREKGAEEAELQAAAKAFVPQARELAQKQAAVLATHYENLARIFKSADEAARKQLVDSLAEEMLNRMSTATALPLFPPGRMEGGRPPDEVKPRGRGDAVPPRPTNVGDEGGRTPKPREGTERRPQTEDQPRPTRPANF